MPCREGPWWGILFLPDVDSLVDPSVFGHFAQAPGTSAVDLIDETLHSMSPFSPDTFEIFLCIVWMVIMVCLSVNSEFVLVGSFFEFLDDLYQTWGNSCHYLLRYFFQPFLLLGFSWWSCGYSWRGAPQVSEDLFLHLHSFLSVLYNDRSASLLILLCSLSSDVELLVNFSFQLLNVSTPEFLLCSLL